MLKLLLPFVLLLSLNFSAFSDTNIESNEKSPRFVIHLLDYLAHDYAGAVEHGKVISPTEYSEQKEFVQKVYELAMTLPEIKNEAKITEKMAKLKKLIETRAEAVDVALLARDVQKDLIVIAKVALAPSAWPSLSNGKKLFEQNCVSCHGQNGLGDGPDGAKLEPRPANFHKEKRMSEISAFHAYNTIRLGVPGTGMISWGQFNDKEVWDLSFYVMSLRHQTAATSAEAKNSQGVPNITLEEVSTLSDNELKEKLTEKDENKKNIALALLRTKNETPTGGDYIGKAKDFLNQAFVAFKKKTPESKDEAKSLALKAYLDGIEPIEPMIKANNPLLVAKIEKEMGEIRKIIADPNGSVETLATQITSTQAVFTEAEESIQAKELSFGVAFSGAFAIILREGFEAVLIVLTLLSVIKAFGNRKAALWVHAGWSSALFLGFVAWFLSGFLMKMSGASREVMEAATSSFAVVVLIYFGFWLHRQTEISRWKKFIQEKVQGAIDNKNLFGLASIAFISVFREAFETVLFIRALWFQTNADGKNAISLGLLAALGLIFAFSYIALRYSKKIPVRELFKVSSVLTTALAFILAGKAVHSMQEAGILNSTMIPWNIRFDTIGLFPTWQTIAAQTVTFLLAMALININAKTAARVSDRA
ncbi:MAG: cytochrome c/FTR1 family iron permease [Bacteriovorax sp.]